MNTEQELLDALSSLDEKGTSRSYNEINKQAIQNYSNQETFTKEKGKELFARAATRPMSMISPVFGQPIEPTNLQTLKRRIGIGEPIFPQGPAPSLEQMATPETIEGLISGATPVPMEKIGAIGLGQALKRDIGTVKPYIKKAVESIKPGKFSERILEHFGEGKTLEENSKEFAKMQKQSYESKFKPYKKEKTELLKKGNGSNFFDIPAQSRYLKKNPEGYSVELLDLHNKLMKSKKLKDADNLLSQMTTTEKQLDRARKMGTLDTAGGLELKAIRKNKDALFKDIINHFKQHGMGYENKYIDLKKYYKENVLPYVSTKDLSKISKGEIENPNNLISIYSAPEKYESKIMKDLGKKGKSKILYEVLGKRLGQSPQEIEKGMETLRHTGRMGEYLPKNYEAMQKELARRIVAMHIGSAIGGTLAGSIFGPIGAGVGGLGALGLSAGKPIVQSLLKHYLGK